VRQLLVNLGISIAIGSLFIWLALRGVNWPEIADVFAAINPLILLGYFLLLVVIQFCRVVRWGILLKPLGEVSFGRLFMVSCVGIMALVLLPLRLGEFARPLLISEPGRIRASSALATIVVERLIDSLAMALLLVVILFLIKDRIIVPTEIHYWAWVVLLGFILLLGLLVVAYWQQEATVRSFRKVVGLVSQKAALRLGSILDSFINGLRALPNLKLVVSYLTLTGIVWFVTGVGHWFAFQAFPDLAQLGLIEAFTVLAVLCVGLMIPAGPGMIGNFHYFVKLGLSLFVSDAILGSDGVAYALLVHAMSLGQQVLFGLPFLFHPQISVRRILFASRELEAARE
jgi:glycosyltransferase 2 family protein